MSSYRSLLIKNSDNSKYCKFVLVLTIVSGTFVQGYSLTCLNPITAILKSTYNNTYVERYGKPISNETWNLMLSLTLSIFFVGGLVGSLCVNFLLTFLRRKQAMIFVHLSILIGTLVVSFGAGLTGSPEAFIIGRFILGFSNGISINLLSIIIAETCIYRRQTFYNSLIGLMLGVADLAGPCFAHSKVLGTESLWPVMVMITAVPSLVYLFCAYWIPETPYLVLREFGRERAKTLLIKLRSSQSDYGSHIDDELDAIQLEQSGFQSEPKEMDEEGTEKAVEYASFKEILLKKQYRMQLFGVLSLYGFEMLCGINTIFFFSDAIFLQAGIEKNMVTYATIGALGIKLLGGYIGIILIGKFGEKKVLMSNSVLMAFSIALITASLATVHLAPAMSYISIVGVALMMLGFSGGPDVTIWSLGVAITTEITRQKILMCGGAAFWISGWLVGFVSSYLQEAFGAYALMVWFVVIIVFLFYFAFFIPETKGKTMEQIQDHFK